MRTQKEIEDKLDELGYMEFCQALSGGQDMSGSAQLMMLNWLTGMNVEYSSLINRGEKVYKAGIRYDWDFASRSYLKKDRQ